MTPAGTAATRAGNSALRRLSHFALKEPGERAIQLGGRFYQANFTPTKQFEVIVRPLGAYMLALAFLQAKAIAEPERYKSVVDATLIVFLLRQIQRTMHAQDVQSAFGRFALRMHSMKFAM